jgi:hypothetical protein
VKEEPEEELVVEEELELELDLELEEGLKEGAGLKEVRVEVGLKNGHEITMGLEKEEWKRFVLGRINISTIICNLLNSLELNEGSSFRWSESK